MTAFGRLLIYREAESTQDLVRDLALRGEPEGTAVMALKQTHGRGREGRSWVSPEGKNLALSVLLRPRLTPRDTVLLGFLVSIAVAETVEARGVPEALLRWPNDVLVRGGKIAGILSEATVQAGTIRFVIVGIGLNVNTLDADFPADLRTPATSLLMSTGHEADLEAVARELLQKLETLYRRVKTEGCAFIPSLWERRWAHRGRMLVHESATGVGQGLDEDGALVLKLHGEKVIRITSGDVDLAPG